MNEMLAAVGRNKIKAPEMKLTSALDLQTALDQSNIDKLDAIEECDPGWWFGLKPKLISS
jgi:hypothetical protein